MVVLAIHRLFDLNGAEGSEAKRKEEKGGMVK